MRDAMKAAEKAGRFSKEANLDPISVRLENIRRSLMGGKTYDCSRKEPTSREVNEAYERIYGNK